MPAKLEKRKVGLVFWWNNFPSQSQIEYNMRGEEKKCKTDDW